MANYNNVISRNGTSALVPEEVSSSMLGRVQTEPDGSAAMRMFSHVPVTSGQVRFPILSALPVAYFVNGDTGLAQSTEMQWSNKFLNIEPLAVYVPIPEATLDDVEENGFDLWGEIQPAVEEAIAREIDNAVFFGVGAPESWPEAIEEAATLRGFSYPEGTADVAEGGIQDDIDALTGVLELAGFDPTGIVAARGFKGKLRRARGTTGERLTGVSPAIDQYLGMGIAYPMRGLFPTGNGVTEAFVGDFTEYKIGIRKDIEVKILDQAVIQDNSGAIVYNLAQQEMVAAKFTLRLGWQVSNRIRYDEPNEADRYPVGVLTTPAS